MRSPVITSNNPAARLQIIFGAIIAVLLSALIFVGQGYLITVMAFAAIYGIFVTGLNFFMGYAGQVSFGQNAFAAIGGYGTAILCTRYNWDPSLALMASMALSVLIAGAVGYPTLRLRGHNLAMATFALGLISYEISAHWESMTQGYMGIPSIPPMGIGGLSLSGERQQLAALLVILLLGIMISGRLRQSRFGRALSAVAGSEDAAHALGIAVFRYKLSAFLISAAYGSAAGSLYAHFVGFLSPEAFGLQMIIWGFTMIFLGGVGTTWGPIIGALLVALLSEAFRGLKDLQDLVYCTVLVLILIFAPKGIVVFITSLLRRRREA
ncbi:MAG: hypothetical protein A3G80_15595 [Betaproteobacteria bacterium RIFCSPLOWO2_12_FULL_62_13b]|nr:MAG: hypothetical protein A3G80_15595 [Betaproteobacteria bacterium RIFCSPLOWO2_12_FULL_62_13b]